MAQRKLSGLPVRSLAGLDAAGCCNGDALCAHTTINIGCVCPVVVAYGPYSAKLTRVRVQPVYVFGCTRAANADTTGGFVRENSRRNLE